MRLVPGLNVARRYEAGWLHHDLAAGVVLTALLLPLGMAYAELAGLPPITGIYATLVPLLAYAVFGPSRILVMGPDSAIAPVVAATVIPLAGDDGAARMAIAAALAIGVGVLCMVGGLARLGFVTDLLSMPVRIGYLAGIAIVVMVDQAPKLLGIEIDVDGLSGEVVQIITSIGEADLTTSVIGAGSIGMLLALRRWLPRIPGALVAVVAGIAAVSLLELEGSVVTMGPVPGGLPHLSAPALSLADGGQIAIAALAISLVAFTDTSVLSRSYASRLGERVDQDQELFALGTANLAAGLFQGFPISSSSSRTPAAEAAGARTQLTGVVAAVVMGLILILGTGLLENLPTTTLAAIVIVAVIGLIDIGALRRLFELNRADFGLAVVSLLGVALIGVVEGIGIAVGASVLALLWRAWHPYTAILGRVPGLKGYHDRERHPEGAQVPGLVMFRFDAPLFFANADRFREGLLDAIAASDPPARLAVIAAEPITDVDSTAADMLSELIAQLHRMGVGLAFAELKGPVKDKVVRYGLANGLADPPFHPTIGAAVHAYLATHDVPWTDWEDAEGRGTP